jgi:putative NIF3 family GTP cyclohydrolase 1 type 2
MLKAHPYEEPAYDIYPLENSNANFGYGAIGELERSMSEKDFLNLVSRITKQDNLKFVEGKNKQIKNIAVCGGSGSDLLETAIKCNADAFITADIKYHSFQSAQGKILLVDAGHYETEIFILKEMKKRIQIFLKNKKLTRRIYHFSKTTNPIRYYNHLRSI